MDIQSLLCHRYHVPDDNEASTESPFSIHTGPSPKEAEIAE